MIMIFVDDHRPIVVIGLHVFDISFLRLILEGCMTHIHPIISNMLVMA